MKLGKKTTEWMFIELFENKLTYEREIFFSINSL